MMFSRSAALGLATLLAATAASAHPVGQSFEVEVDGRLIDAGCVAPVIVPGEPTLCTFVLIEQPEPFDWHLADYDTVSLTVVRHDGETAFRRDAEADPDTWTNIPLTLERGGPHDMMVAFRKGDVTLAERTFALSVEPESALFAPHGIAGMVAAIVLLLLFWTMVWLPSRKP